MTVAGIAAGHCAEPLPTNLDFERGAEGWTMPGAPWRIAEGVGVGGSAAVVWENDDPTAFSYPRQKVPLEPGRTYTFGMKVKVVRHLDGRMTPPAKTAFLPEVAIEYFSAEGKYMSGSYIYYPTADNAVGMDGWGTYESKTPPVPDGVAYGILDFYCKKGMVGKVLFDDFFFVPDPERPVDALSFDRYRDEAFDGPLRVCASLRINVKKHPLDTLVAELRHVGVDGKVRSVTGIPFDRETLVCTLAVEDLARGRHPIAVAIRTKSGEIVGKAQRAFTRLERPARRRVTFDAQHRLLVDGKRFFPLGMYTGTANGRGFDAYRLGRCSEGGFNTMMPYYHPTRQDLDAFQKAGVMVLYTLIDFTRKGYAASGVKEGADLVTKRVEEFRDHPAVLGWYMGDEVPPKHVPVMVDYNNLVHRLDPEHPTWIVLDRPNHVRLLRDAYDVIGVDPYPIGNTRGGIDIASGWTTQAKRESFDACDMWNVPQAFDWGWYRKPEDNGPDPHFPTREEYASMNWQQIAAGANGLIGYAYHAIYRDTKSEDERERYLDIVHSTGRQVAAHIPILLEDPGCAILSLPKGLVGRTWRHEGRDVMLVCNVTRETVSGTVRTEGLFSRVVADFGPTPRLVGGSNLAFDMKPLDVVMFALER